MGFNSEVARDLRDQNQAPRDQSVQLTDSNRLDVTLPSPIAPPENISYARQRSEPKTEEGYGEIASTVAKMEEQRESDRRRLATQEQFTGAPAIPGPEAPVESGSRGQQTRSLGTSETEEEETSEQEPEQQEASEQAQSGILRNFMESQTRANLERRQQLAKATTETTAQEKEGARKQMQQTWRFVNGTQAMFAETIVPLIFMMFTLNIQLGNKVSFRNFDMVPDLSVPETAGVVFFDCGCCFNCLLNFVMIVIPLVPLVILMVIALKAVDAVGGVLGFLFK